MFDTIADQGIQWPFAILWALVLVALGFLFVCWINLIINNNKQKHLWFIFGTLLALGAALYYYSLSASFETTIEGNEVQVFLVSVLSSLELFVGQTHLYDGILSEVIFDKPALLYAFVTLYTFCVLFTGVLLFKFITKRWDSRLWLMWYTKRANASKKGNHIFFGINRYSVMLGKDILKTRDDFGHIIYVDFPGEDENITDFSVSDLFASLFQRSDDRLGDGLTDDDRVVVLKARKHLKDASSSSDPMKYIGLKRLDKWVVNEKNKGYILSENEADNLMSLLSLKAMPESRMKLYCHARKEGIKLQLERYYRANNPKDSGRIHFVDSTVLAVETLKRKENLDMQPISFVDIAKDSKGRKAGYVTSPFNAMILGFGETGQEMLKFLYEFSAFVGQDNNQTDSSFMVFDTEIQRLKGAFLSRCPALENSKRIKWEELQFDTQGTISTEGIRVDSHEFWKEYSDQLPTLNYVVVALGDDRINTEIGIRLMEYSRQKDRSLDKFLILVRLTNRVSQYAELIKFYDEHYCEGKNKLRSFGEDEMIWKHDILTRSGLHAAAKAFYNAYSEASAAKDQETWEKRREHILGTRPRLVVIDPETGKEAPESESIEKYKKYLAGRANGLANLMELYRKEGQDYANCFHAATKLELCDHRFFDTEEYAKRIPEYLEPGKDHYPEAGADYDVLEKLAIGEHLRWIASHEVSGIIPAEKRNELFKRNEYMKAYADIPKQAWDWGEGEKMDVIQHYDWIVVKTTLLLAQKQLPTTVDDTHMEAKGYIPSPVDTSGIKLPETLTGLSEALAKNVHEVWAEGRLALGWKYGPERDEKTKKHPCLIPYEDLTEEEKDFDRATAISTIKFIISQGYQVTK